MSKTTQRQHYRRLRDSIPADLAKLWSQQIVNDLLQNLSRRSLDGTIYLYHPLQGEPDLLSFLRQARLHIALPRVQFGANMTFHLWSPGDELIESSLGLMEPISTALEMIPKPGDVAVVPAIAIDQNGARLGFGGGYYDRWLSRHLQGLSLIVGVVFPPCFCSGSLKTEPHDIAVDLCLTGEQTVNFCDTHN
jgi:5-formyltetrahydrofolate cyclo-ligase